MPETKTEEANWWDIDVEVPEPTPIIKAEVLQPPKVVDDRPLEVVQEERLGQLVNDLGLQAGRVTQGVMSWAELDPEDMDKIPSHWRKEAIADNPDFSAVQIDQYLLEKHNAAKTAWLCQKEAPSGAFISRDIVLGVMRYKGTQEERPTVSLNIGQAVIMPTKDGPTASYESLTLEDSSEQ